jgi:endonuclease/exonuclease/phosphatase family metal-dependent hydrolase
LSQLQQIAVNRPPEASPHLAIRRFARTLSARPPGRWLVKLARRLIQSPPLARSYNVLLRVFAAPDHLTFQAIPARPLGGRPAPLTVMTANLWHDWPRYRRQRARLEAFAQLVELEGADLLLLQEVARSRDLQADVWLAERLGMAHVYGQANGHQQHGDFEEGVAILSRYPLSEPSLCYLAPRPFSLVRRLAVGVTVRAPGGDFLAISAHLGHGRSLNTRQLDRLQAWVKKFAANRPAIVGGDFNTGESSPQMRLLRHQWLDLFRQANPGDEGYTYHLRWPWGNPMFSQRLDYLFLRQGSCPWRLIEAQAVQSPGQAHSDHLAVLARLQTVDSHPGKGSYLYTVRTSGERHFC